MLDSIGVSWKLEKKLNTSIAKVTIAGEQALLAKPNTFYNDTGLAARKIADYYDIPPADILVLHDDLALPFGTIRLRLKGSPAGNNGIKSLNAHLGEDYARVRIGVYNKLRERMGDTKIVLANFSRDEQAVLASKVIPEVTIAIDDFVRAEFTPHSINTLN